MNKFSKILTKVLVLCTVHSKANRIYENCFTLSKQYVGKGKGEQFSSMDQLLSGEITLDMHLQSFTTCQNDDGNVIGLQFELSKSDYGAPKSFANDETLLPIGQMSGKCSETVLTAPLQKIVASPSKGGGLKGLRFYSTTRGKSGKALTKTVGKLEIDDHEQWFLPVDPQLVGYFGSHSEAGIEHLGFITLDTACKAREEQKEQERIEREAEAARKEQEKKAKEEEEKKEEQEREENKSEDGSEAGGNGVVVDDEKDKQDDKA